MNKKLEEFNEDRIGADNGYFCRTCRARMNNAFTWKKHINGQRHQKAIRFVRYGTKEVSPQASIETTRQQLKIAGGSRFLETKQREEIAVIQKKFELMDEPVIGLDFIREVWRQDESKEPIYYCQLCQADCQLINIFDHVIGYRHRLRFLKFKNQDKYRSYARSFKKKSELTYYLAMEARDLEEKYGKGVIKISVEICDDIDLQHVENNNNFIESTNEKIQNALGTKIKQEKKLSPPSKMCIEVIQLD